jgi:putative intracellular protease/amidase
MVHWQILPNLCHFCQTSSPLVLGLAKEAQRPVGRFAKIFRSFAGERRMSGSYFIWAGALVLVCVMGIGGWVFSLPATLPATAPLIPPEETSAMLASLKPRRERPIVAIIGLNDATETTDYLMPAGILRRSGVADVTMLATGPGPVQLFPVLKVEADATIVEFDAAHPTGADYVIVPAMSRDDDPAVLSWLKRQAEKGAVIIGICAGAKVVAAAGLLDGRRATTHWYYLGEMLKRHPAVQYVMDRRMVGDDRLVTTTGITASMPMMLTLIEAIAGRAKAEAVARGLGVASWNARHASGAFRFSRPFATTVLLNKLVFWSPEVFDIRVERGVDEVSLALVADAWARTYRSQSRTLAASLDTVESRNGVRILPDRAETERSQGSEVSIFPDVKPANALDLVLDAITMRYGKRIADVVAMQLEYQRR